MAYTVASGAVLEITLEYHLNGQLCMNVHHYYMEKAGGIPDGRAGAVDVMNWWQGAGGQFAAYENVISADVKDLIVYAQWITPVRYGYIQSQLPPAVGIGPANAAPQNVQVSITLKGDEAGKHNQGRKSVGAVPISWIVGGQLTPIPLGLYQDLADAMRETHVGNAGEEYSPVIFNRVTPELSPVITESFVQPTARVERRRTVGVGA